MSRTEDLVKRQREMRDELSGKHQQRAIELEALDQVPSRRSGRTVGMFVTVTSTRCVTRRQRR
jgi:hypothetical protein